MGSSSNLDVLKRLTNQLIEKDSLLKLSSQKYYEVFNSVAHPMILIDRETTRPIEVNQEATEVYGYSKEEFLTVTKGQVVDDYDNFEKIIKNGQPFRIGYDKTKDGILFPVEVYYSYFKLNDEDVVVCSVIDISDKISIIKDLKLQNELYKGLVESTEDLIVRVDLNNNFNFLNKAYCDKFGICYENYIGKPFLPFVHPEDVDLTLRKLEEVKSPPYRVKYPQKALTKTGWRTFEWEVTLIFDENKIPIEYQAVGRDITIKTELIETLNQQKQYYKNLLEMFPCPVLVTDLECNIIESNHLVSQLTGKSEDELKKYNACDLLLQQDKNKLKIEIESLKEGKQTIISGEYNFKCGDENKKGYLKIALVRSLINTPIAFIGSVMFEGVK